MHIIKSNVCVHSINTFTKFKQLSCTSNKAKVQVRVILIIHSIYMKNEIQNKIAMLQNKVYQKQYRLKHQNSFTHNKPFCS